MKIDELLLKNAGRVIRAHRKVKGYSREELAHRSDIHHTHLGNIERGTSAATLPTLFKVAGGLDLNPSLLIKEVEEDIILLYKEDARSRT